MTKSIVVKATKKQHFTDEERKSILSQFNESTEGLNAFCKRMGVNTGSVRMWQKKFGTCQTLTYTPTETKALTAVVSDPFIEVQELKAQNAKLASELHAVRGAFGRKLMELEMERH